MEQEDVPQVGDLLAYRSLKFNFASLFAHFRKGGKEELDKNGRSGDQYPDIVPIDEERLKKHDTGLSTACSCYKLAVDLLFRSRCD